MKRSLLLLLVLAAACRSRPDAQQFERAVGRGRGGLDPVSAEERLAYIRGSQLWHPVAVEKRDLLDGPDGPDDFRHDERIRCTFVEPRPGRVPPTGSTSKFLCARGDDLLVVKYGSKEVYAEVLGSRLLWALGFAADRVYPVRVECRGCPPDPWAVTRGSAFASEERGTHVFDDAIVKRRYDGASIETCEQPEGRRCLRRRLDEGWSWAELELVDPEQGGAPRAHVDALKLFAAFIQHGDSKAENHRLVCPKEAIKRGRCEAPMMMMSDLGSTFGGGAWLLIGSLGPLARARLASWQATSVWRDPERCKARLSAQFEIVDPIVSEEGRAFLARLLERLSDDQLRDLFRAARIERLGETTRDPGGRERPVTVEDWVRAFKARRAEIVNHRCPSP